MLIIDRVIIVQIDYRHRRYQAYYACLQLVLRHDMESKTHFITDRNDIADKKTNLRKVQKHFSCLNEQIRIENYDTIANKTK